MSAAGSQSRIRIDLVEVEGRISLSELAPGRIPALVHPFSCVLCTEGVVDGTRPDLRIMLPCHKCGQITCCGQRAPEPVYVCQACALVIAGFLEMTGGGA